VAHCQLAHAAHVAGWAGGRPLTLARSLPTPLAFVSGKSTLIRSLVKNWTKQNLKEANGPVTVVTGKGRRVTLIE